MVTKKEVELLRKDAFMTITVDKQGVHMIPNKAYQQTYRGIVSLFADIHGNILGMIDTDKIGRLVALSMEIAESNKTMTRSALESNTDECRGHMEIGVLPQLIVGKKKEISIIGLHPMYILPIFYRLVRDFMEKQESGKKISIEEAIGQMFAVIEREREEGVDYIKELKLKKRRKAFQKKENPLITAMDVKIKQTRALKKRLYP